MWEVSIEVNSKLDDYQKFKERIRVHDGWIMSLNKKINII